MLTFSKLELIIMLTLYVDISALFRLFYFMFSLFFFPQFFGFVSAVLLLVDAFLVFKKVKG